MGLVCLVLKRKLKSRWKNKLWFALQGRVKDTSTRNGILHHENRTQHFQQERTTKLVNRVY